MTSKAISISRSSSQVCVASIWSCSRAISSHSFCMALSSIGSASCADGMVAIQHFAPRCDRLFHVAPDVRVGSRSGSWDR